MVYAYSCCYYYMSDKNSHILQNYYISQPLPVVYLFETIHVCLNVFSIGVNVEKKTKNHEIELGFYKLLPQ